MEANENTYILQEPSPQTASAFTISKAQNPNVYDTDEDTNRNTSGHNQTSNLKQTAFNYVNTIIGSGVIGIPYALSRSGFWFGLILLVGIAALTDYSLCILIKAGNLAGVSTYQDVVEAAYGRWGFYLLTVIQFIYPFIAMISYNVIIGDSVTKVFRRLLNVSSSSALGNRNSVVFFCTVFIMLPLSLQKNISKLAKVSLTSVGFIFIIIGFIIYRVGTLGPSIPRTSQTFSFINDGVAEAIGVISFAYMCHHNSFLLYESLENSTQKRWNRVTHLSVGMSCLIVFVFGVTGYMTFGDLSQGDLFENYCSSDDLANFARLLFTLTIMLTYPFECFVVRQVLETALWGGKPPQTTSHHVLLTVAIVFLGFILSTLTDCLGIVLELNGILAAVPLAFIFPAVTYLKLDSGHKMSWSKAPAYLLAVFGGLVAICGSIYVILRVMNGASCSHGIDMPYCIGNFSANIAT
ncbi:putative sodium-coupled neutral amino acid transporter 11 isoform X2 [Brevipalpus obovatus]|uniref:putative sodium-coupled neutral amino acid transporter 11 isoform X2 n=1 Tax=Brevipalpus obovatus TaxID=246614 RepID=UPI003D9F00C4